MTSNPKPTDVQIDQAPEWNELRNNWLENYGYVFGSCKSVAKSAADFGYQTASARVNELETQLAELGHNARIAYDKLFDEAETIRIERDELRDRTNELASRVLALQAELEQVRTIGVEMQRETNRKLSAENDIWSSSYKNIEIERNRYAANSRRLAQENDRLRAALEFYADRKNWETDTANEYYISNKKISEGSDFYETDARGNRTRRVDYGGLKARLALGEKGE